MTRKRLDTLGLVLALAVILWVMGGIAWQTVDAYGHVRWQRELRERHTDWRLPPSGRPAP